MTFTEAINIIREQSGSDIGSIISDYVELKRSGRGFRGRCPFHDEKTPSFHVSEEKEIYKCFGCQVGGDAIDFIMRIEGKEFHEAIYQLAGRYHINIENDTPAGAREKVSSAEKIIPGIKELRREIRKADKVFIAFNESGRKKCTGLPAAQLPAPLTSEPAAILRKYTRNCVLVVNGLDWPGVKASIQKALEHDFIVFILNPTFVSQQEDDWLDFILPEVGGQITRKEVIKILAGIPDDLLRSIYITHFSKNYNQKKAL